MGTIVSKDYETAVDFTSSTKRMNQKARDALVAAVPCGRIGAPEDIWLAVKFAIECDYFNGATIDVNGGLVMS